MIFGSLLNGLFDNKQSDLDLTIITDTSDQDHYQILMKCCNALKENPKYDFSQNGTSEKQRPFWAKFGCQFTFKARVNNQLIDVDLAVNKYLEIRNSQLIQTYCKLDRRYKDAAFVLKACFKGFDEDKVKRPNSFSIYLLLLAFMINKNYLPNLQQ